MPNIPRIEIYAKTNYGFGFALGKRLKDDIKKRIETNKVLYTKWTKEVFTELENRASKFLPAVKEEFPQIYEEIEGLSAGSGISMQEINTMMCEEEILYSPVPHCTSFAVRTDTRDILIGHNEDWIPSYRHTGLYIVKASIAGRQEFLAVGYIGALPGGSCGLNKYGIAFTGNSLSFKRYRYGIPKSVWCRALLNCSKIVQAEKLVELKDHSIASNTLLVWKNRQIEDIETFWEKDETYEGGKWLVHTNNPIAKKEQNKFNTSWESVKRYMTANNILKKAKRLDLETVKQVLTDHTSGICGHIEHAHPTYGVTLASVIMNPMKKWMMVSSPTPCNNPYSRFELV